MRVLILGGTGSIGAPIVRDLLRAEHQVFALARSESSRRKLEDTGAIAVAGDLERPELWLASLPAIDGIIQVAAGFTDRDQAIERHLLDHLLPTMAAAPRAVKFVYTGGCWLYGETQGRPTTEDSPYEPLPAFAWSVPHIERVLSARGIHPIVIHPAMVYEAGGGVFARFSCDATSRDAVRVVGHAQVHWPLVHSEDLAALYRLALEGSAPRQTYIGAAIVGVPVGRIARAFARRFGTPEIEPQEQSADQLAAELGEWAKGYALDQRQSGEKARRVLGWRPRHLDPVSEIAALL
jgi:nucleoside-diphosphate-sugar epimerase